MVDFAEKHIKRAAPELKVAIEGAVDNHLLFSFGMIGNIFDEIEIALEMFINTVNFDLSF